MTVTIGLCLVVGSLILIAICLFRKNESFFNLRKVTSEHFGLFSQSRGHIAVIYGLPALFAIGLSMIYQAGTAFYNELSIILGILLSMLLAILSILSGYDFSTIEDANQKKKGIAVVKQTINSIVFVSMIIIGLLLYGLVGIVISGSSLPAFVYALKPVASGFAYYIFFVILLNLLIIIKQMSKIVEFNLEVKRGCK